MRCQPDGEYCWIAHMENHNGEFNVLWPQNKLIVETINRWDGDSKLVYGRPRHSQSQGLV